MVFASVFKHAVALCRYLIYKHQNMKKTILAIVLAAMVAAGCGGNTQIEGFNNYKEACAVGRYDVAHRFLANMKLEAQDGYEEAMAYREASEYVFKQELTYLISMGDQESVSRLLLLFKQTDLDKRALLENTDAGIDLAISLNNDLLLEKLIMVYPEEDFSDVMSKKIITYYSASPAKLRAYIMQNISKPSVAELARSFAAEHRDIEVLNRLMSVKPEMIYDLSVLKLLAELDYDAFMNKIRNVLTELEAMIPSRPPLGIVKSDPYGELEKEYVTYIDAVKNFNKVLCGVMEVAVKTGELALANDLCQRVRTNLTYKNLGDWVRVVEKEYDHSSVYRAYDVSDNGREDIDLAKSILRRK